MNTRTSITAKLSDEEILVLAARLKLGVPDALPLSGAYRASVESELLRVRKLDLRRKHPCRPVAFNEWSFLAELTHLDTLNLHGSTIRDLSPIQALEHLRVLYLSETTPETLAPLTTLRQLEWLVLDSAFVNDISVLSKLSKLGFLSLYRTQVSDLSPLSNLKALTALDIRRTPVHDITPLIRIKTLKRLRLDGNDAQNIDILTAEHFPSLKDLTIFTTTIIRCCRKIGRNGSRSAGNCPIAILDDPACTKCRFGKTTWRG